MRTPVSHMTLTAGGDVILHQGDSNRRLDLPLSICADMTAIYDLPWKTLPA